MKFSFLFKSPETTTTASWPWPSCATNSKTLSFREDNKNNIENGFSYHRHIQYYDEEMIKGLRSERFFFEPGKSNSILEEAKTQSPSSKQGVVTTLEIESRDPVLDFRVSMEEMVEAHGLKDWESLERLLACYLRVNGKNNHRYIIGAFVDLLFSDQPASCTSSISSSLATTTTTHHHHCCSFTSPLSFSSSSSTYSSACNLSHFLGI